MQEMVAKDCFVIAPIGEPESDERKRSDQILSYVIEPAVQRLGYKPIRADNISEPGIITTQIIQHIIDDPLVVADLSGRNPNVFYELALRHALRRPYVQLIQRGERIPFDVAAIRTIEVDHRDLDSVAAAKVEIERQVRSMQGSSEVDSPISMAVDLELLRQSGNPEQRQLADVLAAIGELRSGLSLVEKKLSDPAQIIPSGYLRDILLHDLRFILPDVAHVGRRSPIAMDLILDLLSNAHTLNQIVDRPNLGEMDVQRLKNTAARLLNLCEMLGNEMELSWRPPRDPRSKRP